jgi:hypothetical protein
LRKTPSPISSIEPNEYATIENLALTAEPAEPRLAILCVPRY